LPGAEYDGAVPDGFMARDEVVATLEGYARRFSLPVVHGVRVGSVEPGPAGRGYLIRANGTVWKARHVVVATGLFQEPRRPSFSAELSPKVRQLHTGQYRNPASLPNGAVLVVGSAQSGCQIAEELYQSGRRVYLSLGSAGRVPRRYRGRDIFEWLHTFGFFDRTVEKLPSPQARFAGNPHLTGRNGGHTINLHQFARDGVILLGRLQSASGEKVSLAPDVRDSLAKADKFEAEILKMIDGAIEQKGLEAPPEQVPTIRDGYQATEVTEIDLGAAGIATIIWATGYRFDFSLVRLPVFEPNGFPLQHRGVTGYPGLFFAGLPWLDTQKTGLLLGVGEQTGLIASAIASSKRT
jgi:putative flavoprotein involved in K+ transport